MAPKRPRSEGTSYAAPSRKEQKIAQRRGARVIAVDSGTGRPPPSSVPSALPAQLDVEQAITARRFQIESLQKAIRASKASSSTRAWQLLPRHARRRAASHNILRLPAKLRPKGLSELKASNTVPKTRSETRSRLANHPRSKALARKEELLQRATKPGARWLETHMWFAKRFRMSRDEFDGSRWGYVLPEVSHMKSQKTDWRAAKSGCGVFDASYEEWIRVSCKVAKQMVQDPLSQSDSSAIGQNKARLYLQEALKLSGLRVAAEEDLEILPETVVDAVLHAGNPGPSDQLICPVTIYVEAPRIQAPSSDLTSSVSEGAEPGTLYRHRSPSYMALRDVLSALGPEPRLSEIYPDYEVLLCCHPAASVRLRQAVSRGIKKRKVAGGHSELDTGTHFVVTTLERSDAHNLAGLEGFKQRHYKSEPGLKNHAFRKAAVMSEKSMSKSPDILERQSSCSAAQVVQSMDGKATDRTHLERMIDRRLFAAQRHSLRSRSFNLFKLYGPRSGQVLKRVLRPAQSTGPEAMATWKRVSEGSISQPAHQKDRVVLNISVLDPRLGNSVQTAKAQKKDTDTANSTGPPGHVMLRTDPSRHILSEGYDLPRFTKGDIDERRSRKLVSGLALEALKEDDTVPILIVQNWVAHRPSNNDAATCLDGYSVIVPQGWAMPFFHALVSTSARPFGQQSLRLLSLEAATPAYPYDWSGSPGWATYLGHSEQKRFDAWNARPRGKRLEWDKVGTRWPFGGPGMWKSMIDNSRACLMEVLNQAASVQHQEDRPVNTPVCSRQEERVHLMGSSGLLSAQVQSLRSILCPGTDEDSGAQPASSAEGCPIPRPRPLPAIRSIISSGNPSTSHPFVLVQLRPLHRGRLEEGDEIHLDRRIALRGDTTDEEVSAHRTSHVGTITSGCFSLSRGIGFGLGVVAREAWLLSCVHGTSQDLTGSLLVRSRNGGPERPVEAYALLI